MTDPMQHSEAVPTGSAGLVNQGRGATVELVGPIYGAAAEAATAAALSKVDADLADLSAVPNIATEGTHTT